MWTRTLSSIIGLPLLFGIIFLGTISGMIPYLEGPKIALWVAMKNKRIKRAIPDW